MLKAGCWGRAERMGATRRKLKATTMTSQRKRLQSYLKGRGLEVQESDGARAMAVQNAWGGLNAPDLMDRVLDRSNFDEAVRRVVANRGAPGVDGMSASELPVFVEQHWDGIYSDLRTGRYKPFPVRRVEIPKPDGGSATWACRQCWTVRSSRRSPRCSLPSTSRSSPTVAMASGLGAMRTRPWPN